MTPDQQNLVLSLVWAPLSPPELSPQEFLLQFGADDGYALGLSLLRDAIERQDRVDTELALIVCGTFGITRDHLDLLICLVPGNWHVKHEDVVAELGRLRAPEAVDVLYLATWWVPDYLDYDEFRNLARKAVRALSVIPGEEAEQALTRAAASPDETVNRHARKLLERKRRPDAPR